MEFSTLALYSELALVHELCTVVTFSLSHERNRHFFKMYQQIQGHSDTNNSMPLCLILLLILELTPR